MDYNDKFFDRYGRIVPFGENSILFLAEYVRLYEAVYQDISSYKYVDKIEEAIEASFQDGIDNKENLSHDNMTAIISLSKQFNLEYHKRLIYPQWYRRLHPRDVILYFAALNWLTKLLMLPLMFIPAMCMLYSCLPHYKIINGEKVLATDGMCLNYIRCKTWNMRLTYWLCTKLMSVCYKTKTPWTYIYSIYFKDERHPNNILMRKLGI